MAKNNKKKQKCNAGFGPKGVNDTSLQDPDLPRQKRIKFVLFLMFVCCGRVGGSVKTGKGADHAYSRVSE